MASPFGNAFHPNRKYRNAAGDAADPGADPYYNPEAGYGSGYGNSGPNPDKFMRTGMGKQYAEQNPEAYYGNFTAKKGLTGAAQSPFDDYIKGEYSNAQRGYQTALTRSPNLKWQSYLKTLGTEQDWRNRYQMLSPGQRGEDAQLYGAGPTRTIAF